MVLIFPLIRKNKENKMFKDYKGGYNRIKKSSYYTIIDDDFEIKIDNKFYIYEICNSIIIIYSQKNFPIVDNLVLFILRVNKKLGWKINYTIYYLDKFSPTFRKYKKEVEKLLLFS